MVSKAWVLKTSYFTWRPTGSVCKTSFFTRCLKEGMLKTSCMWKTLYLMWCPEAWMLKSSYSTWCLKAWISKAVSLSLSWPIWSLNSQNGKHGSLRVLYKAINSFVSQEVGEQSSIFLMIMTRGSIYAIFKSRSLGPRPDMRLILSNKLFQRGSILGHVFLKHVKQWQDGSKSVKYWSDYWFLDGGG